MNDHPELIVMLTHNDLTLENAAEVFETCKNSKAEYWGFKEKPIGFEKMKKLFGYMKDCGKKTVLEVVSYEEKECVRGAEAAVSCGCDYLMGTMYFDSVSQICAQNNIKYMPFAGEVYGRPSILGGSVESIIAQAKELSSKGVYGFDLLGYRFTGNASLLNERFVSQIDLPVCIAGSINSFERLDEIKAVSPWAFTVGSAFFENKFGADIAEQIDCVCDYIKS